MNIWLYALVSVFIVSFVSFSGLVGLSFTRNFLQKITLLLVALAVGALLGDVFIHLLPEIFAEQGSTLASSLYIIVGILLFFLIEKIIRWRHSPSITQHSQGMHSHHVGPMNLIADGAHNFIDGVLIGVSYMVSLPIGIATTIAVILHEIPTEIGDFGVLLHAGYSTRRALQYNFLSALMAVAGTLLALSIGPSISSFTTAVLPITAGGFLYIAGSDLIPELHREINLKHTLLQFLAILAGIGLMVALLWIE